MADLLTRYGQLTGLERLEVVAESYRQRTTAEVRTGEEGADSSEVTIVFFDSDAVEEWPYYSPYPRAVLAELIEGLSAAGPSVIGLDVFLEEPSAFDPEGDRRLAEAIRAAGNVVLVAPTVVEDEGPVVLQPDSMFANAAAAVAVADLPTAFDRAADIALVARSGNELVPGFAVAMYALHRGLDLDSLMLAARSNGRLDLPGLDPRRSRIPEGWWDAEGRADEANLAVPIRFLGPPSHLVLDASTQGATQTLPVASSSVAGTMAMFLPESFQDRILVLGTGWHETDRFRTVFSDFDDPTLDTISTFVEGGVAASGNAYEWTYGVEIHAQFLQTLLDEEQIRSPGPVLRWSWLVAPALLVTAGVFQGGSVVGLGWLLLTLLIGIAGGFWAWAGEIRFGAEAALLDLPGAFVMLPMVAILLSPTVAYALSSAWVALVENREKRFIQGAFGKYVSPDVVRSISEDPDALRLGGQKRMLSVFFSDLSGFTTLSERLAPEELIAHLNEYLSEMTGVVMEEKGTLDKYIGDAIMAFWNAPAPVEDHADRALRCAIMTQRKMTELNARWLEADPDADTLVVRIGINSGEVVVGNVGGENRFDYSAIGDAVNLAARLEPANKAYDTLSMCSEFTLALLRQPEDFRLRELDFLAVKGKTRPVKVYEIVELADQALPPERERALALFEQGLARYRRHEWAEAAEDFRAALEADPTDGPSRVYLERSEENAADPPPADWDFVVRRTVK